MNLPALAILALSVGTTLAAPVPKELKRNSDAERMQGVWVVTVGEPGAKGYRWTFEGEKMFAGGTADTKGIEYGLALRLNNSIREFDLSRDGRISHIGICKFVGDELHVAYHNHERPTEFSTNGGKYHLHILKPFLESK